MMRPFTVDNREIGFGCPPFIVAEMSGNHNGSLERALEIVDAAAAAGASAVKIQTFTPDSMTLDIREDEFMVRDPESLWKGESLYQLYEKAQTPWEWHAPIFDRCRARGIVGFSTPFDSSAIRFLVSLDAPLFKIASPENVDVNLIREAAATGRPLMISTGMASADEIGDAVAAARDGGCRDLVLMKCTSAYPARPDEANLATLKDLGERFGCAVGYSDHTLGIGAAVTAVALGAAVIEKHFTLSRKDGGVDSAFSVEPAELAQLAAETETAWRSLGAVRYGATKSEERSLQYRRSLYFVRDVAAGTVVDETHVRAIRPGRGLPPKHYREVIGRRTRCAVRRGTPVSFDCFE